ncbi:hypothetical protein ACTXT7_011581 [Hymenolepis weldensis]
MQINNQGRDHENDHQSQCSEGLFCSLFPKVPPCLKFYLNGTRVQPLPWSFRKLLRWKSNNTTPKVVMLALMRSHFQSSDRERTQGLEEFNFIPKTFCIPSELDLLEKEWLAEGEPHYWIIKPPAKARGIGIQVATKWSQIIKADDVIVQKYISNPFLINNVKFDLRIYVFLYSVYPLIVYVHKEGLVRFASHQTLSVLWQYMSNNGIDWIPLWEKIKDIVVKTCISAEHNMKEAVKTFCTSPYNVQELFGFDIILDENLKPWLLENILKSGVVCEIVNLIATPDFLPINIVCPQVAHPHLSEKLTQCSSDDSCRGTADSALFQNQRCPHYPFLSLQPSSPIKARKKSCPHAPPHPSDEDK